MIFIWDKLIGIKVFVDKKSSHGKIIKFGNLNGERTVLVDLNDFEEWFLFNEVTILESELNILLNNIDKEILELTDIKFSILNFFNIFPNRKKID